MMEIHVLEESDFTPRWATVYRDFVACHPHSNIYHTLEWHAVIQETYGYSPVYILLEKSGEVQGTLPLFLVRGLLGKRLVSIPFSHWVPILAKGDETLQALLEAAQGLCLEKNCDFVALRHGRSLPDQGPWQCVEDNSNSVLQLNRPISDIWKGLDAKSARWAVNRARRDGVVVDRKQDAAAYRTFYQLEVQTRRRQAMPVYPPCLFDSMRRHLAGLELSQVMLAYLSGQAVAGTIVWSFNGTVIYGYAASVADREILRSQPMDLLVWEVIQSAHEDGAHQFDFGTTPRFHQGLLRFKEKWGATSSPIPYYYWVPSGRKHSVNRRGLLAQAIGAVLQRLPERAYIWASTLIMREIG